MEVVSKQQSSRRATPFQATLHLRPATLSPYSLHACRLGRSVIYSSRQRGSGDDSVASPLRLTALRHNQSQMLQERSRKRSYKLRVAIET
ncbi:uncharacterized protein LOC123513155 isoform X3 [Portunus trituberculatus]|uniref:uncharacterized protein LOC123513155 isoform X3 n=1 Tax=Portunus trituberculatus TaxID=210409 RepID=UPI001E1CD513|nr:uncharacterized protein LOC123513155 isoform X3 [Portunus trituberculatus]